MPYVIISVAHGRGGGGERVLCELLTAWPAEYPEIILVAPSDSQTLQCARDYCKIVIPFPAKKDSIWFNIPAALKIASSVPRGSLFHSWTERSYEIAVLLARRTGGKATGTMHSHPFIFQGKTRRRIMHFSSGYFPTLTCASKAVADACREFRYKCELRVIHNGINDLSLQRKQASRIRIGFLGMSRIYKGFHIVRKWIEQSSQDTVVWKLFGDIHPAFQKEAEALARAFPDRVKLCGYQTPNDIFSQIDILVQTSDVWESFGLVLAEAASARIPCVSSDVGGMGEVILDGDTGFLFSPSSPHVGFEKLMMLIQNQELRQSMGLRARKRFESLFTAERMAAEYQEMWSSIS